jgi:hypothetical protein
MQPNTVRSFGFMLVCFVVSSFIHPLQSDQPQQTWIQLFDGKSLKGWHTLPGGEWKVENKTLVGTSSKEERRHGLLVSDRKFRDFEISIQYKAIKGNSGLYFRSEEIDGAVGVHGFQAEIDPTGNAGGLYETGGREWVVSPKAEDVAKWYKPGKWNTMTVMAKQGHIVVTVNGYKTAELVDDPGRREGVIALQLHGEMDMHICFRDIKIREL